MSTKQLTEHECTALLTQHGIRPTANRIVVVKALAAASRPLSMTELEYSILTIDKSNVFRALNLFREHHLVHAIESGSEGLRYELCLSHSQHEDDDAHVHFYCEQCHQTFCLDDTAIPPVPLPQGFAMTSANYVVKGLCASCASHAGCHRH